MKTLYSLAFCFLLTTLPAFAQFSSTASHIRYGTSLPATCNPATGDVFYKTSITITVYYCSATNTWSAIGGSGTVTGTGTTNQYTYWSSSTALTSTSKLVNATSWSTNKTPTTPILQGASDGTSGAFYGSSTGSGPSEKGFSFDFSLATEGKHVYFIPPTGTGVTANLIPGTAANQNWVFQGLTSANSPNYGEDPRGSSAQGGITTLFGQTASKSTTALLGLSSTESGSNIYSVAYSLATQSGTGTVSLTLAWTDINGKSQTVTTTPLTANSAGSQLSGQWLVNTTAATAINYSTTVIGTVNYDVVLSTLH